ncbi:MAG: MobC family plasmid mobilization relaxosome protein [Oscillospiraceae bacterium]
MTKTPTAMTEILKFRVTPEQKKLIEHKALSSYSMTSEYLRDCAMDKKITVISGLDDAANELRRIGNNLNQLTRAVNSGLISAVDLSGMREEVARIWQLLSSLQRDVH